MRNDLSRIVASLIGNIGSGKGALGDDNRDVMIDIASATTKGLNIIKNEWPDLTPSEKQELATIILALNTIYSYDENEKNKKLKRW